MGMIKTFSHILKRTQPELKELVKAYLNRNGYSIVEGDGFLYGKGDIPILLVAHLDTVHEKLPSDIYYDKNKDTIWAKEGIGGDDRCGVYIILSILASGYKPYVVFTEDEEIGCVGARKFVDTIVPPNIKFIVEIDRRGHEDCVFYDCDNKEFHKYIQKFGFKKNFGSYSDICVISDAWNIASVNLSSGYYFEHTNDEYICLSDVKRTAQRVAKILEDDINNKEYFDYQKRIYYYNSGHTNNIINKNKKLSEYYDEYYDEYGYIDANGKYHWYGEEM